MALVFIVSAVPGKDIEAVADDRLEHFVEYFILGWLIILALAGFTNVMVSGMRFGAAWIFGVLHAITDELHQSFVPNRDASLNDVLFDTAGLTVAIFLIALLLRATSARS